MVGEGWHREVSPYPDLALFGVYKPNFGRSPLTAAVTLILPAHAIAQHGIAVWFRVSPKIEQRLTLLVPRDTHEREPGL